MPEVRMRLHRHRSLALVASFVVAALAGCYHRGMTRYPQLSDSQQQLIQAGDSALIVGGHGLCWYLSRIERVDSRYHTEACIRHAADTTMYLYRYPDRGVVVVGRRYTVDAAQTQRITDSVVRSMSQLYGREEKCPPIQDPDEFDSKHYRWRSGGLTMQVTTDAFGRTPAVTVETELGDWECSEWLGIPLAN